MPLAPRSWVRLVDVVRGTFPVAAVRGPQDRGWAGGASHEVKPNNLVVTRAFDRAAERLEFDRKNATMAPADGYSLAIDPDGIVTIGFDLPGKVNIMNDDFMTVMPHLLNTLEARRSDLRGVILTSRKSTFFASGDLALMLRCQREQEQFIFDHFELLKSFFRRLERMELPLVAAINGTALGGGYELCLACHRRIALANPKTRIGLPEVTFGILPAAGGVIRLTAVLGILPALEFLVTGRSVTVDEALRPGSFMK